MLCRVIVPDPPRLLFFFFFNDTATTEIYTLSLHDALPIFRSRGISSRGSCAGVDRCVRGSWKRGSRSCDSPQRSEEHTSELQSRSDLVCRLLLEKKKKTSTYSERPLYHASTLHPSCSSDSV